MTKVYDQANMTVYATYDLPPEEAIVKAWEQYHKDKNTWWFAKEVEAETYPLTRTRAGWTMGRFWVDDPKGDLECEPR